MERAIIFGSGIVSIINGALMDTKESAGGAVLFVGVGVLLILITFVKAEKLGGVE